MGAVKGSMLWYQEEAAQKARALGRPIYAMRSWVCVCGKVYAAHRLPATCCGFRITPPAAGGPPGPHTPKR